MRWPRLTGELTTSAGTQRLAALDGYRGLFVTLVLLYHFGVTALVGGWVGINHFFVFSGYLITRLLISERARTGRIDVLRFYRRRAERLVPALLVVSTAVLVSGLFVGSADRHRDAGDVLASLFFVQNWRLISQDDAYFEQVGNPSPLRHAWTLGVEEQFYLLVPALVLLLFLLFARSRTGRFLVVAGLTLGSVWWTIHLAGSGTDFSRLYYGTDTRAQALLVGAGTAVLLGRDHRGRLGRRPSRPATQAIGVVGLLISLSAFVIVGPRSEWLFTGGGMLLFAVGAVMMGLTATDPRPMLINRVAAWPPAVLLGQMTYGLYLYHWPIHLWLGPVLEGWPLAVSVAIKLALTVAVAFVSFRWLEVPVLQHGFGVLVPRRLRARLDRSRAGERGRRRGGQPVWWVPVAGTAVVALVAVAAFTRPVSEEDLDVPPLVASDGDVDRVDPPLGFALLGDSVGVSLGDGWRDAAYPGVTMSNHSRIGCDLIDAPLIADGSPMPEDASCADWREDWPAEVEEAGATSLLVLPGAQFIGDHEVEGEVVTSGSPELAALIKRTLTDIEVRAKEAGVTHVQVATMPCRRVDPDKLDPSLRQFAGPISDPGNITWVNGTVTEWAGGEGEEAAPTEGVQREVLDLHGALCADGYTPEVNGIPLYGDTVHFSPAGAATVWTWLTPRVVTASGR